MSDITSKLLNYATQDNAKLKLYTELNNSFTVGQKVFICGGFYDNTSQLVNFSQDPSLFTLSHLIDGYTVLATDTEYNSITIDISVSSTPVYPYGVTLNPLGNPLDLTNTAYNTYTGANLYNNVYISTNKFISGNISNCTINNGTFGIDDFSINIGRNSDISNLQSTTINHIGVKNAILKYATINSKTDIINPSTKKFSIIEDAIVFSLNLESTTSNNAGYGYSIFEKLFCSNDVVINNGVFDNFKTEINSSKINKAKIGNRLQNPGLVLTIDEPIENSELFALRQMTTSDLKNSSIDTYIPFNVVSATYSATSYQIDFVVDYKDIANKFWSTTRTCHILGINYLNLNGFSFWNIDLNGTMKNVSYTFGSMTASFSILFDIATIITGTGYGQLNTTWSAYKTANPINTLDFSKLQLHFTNYTYQITATNSVLSTFIDNISLTYPITNCTLNKGYYKQFKLDKSTNIVGNSYLEPVYLENNIQYVDDSITTNIAKYTYFKSGKHSANFDYCNIYSGIIHNSVISNTTTDTNPLVTTYIDNVILRDGSKIESNVLWDNVTIDFINTTYPNQSYLGDRTTKWKTGFTSNSPIYSNAYNINKISLINANGKYNSQTEIVSGVLKYEVPSIHQMQPSIDTTKQMIIKDHGEMYKPGLLYYLIFPYIKTRILFADYLDSNATLETAITTKANFTPLSSTYTTFPAITDYSQVDDNFVYTENDYNVLDETRSHRDITIDIHQLLTINTNFLDPSVFIAESRMSLKIIPQYGPQFPGLLTTGTVAIPNGPSELHFEIDSSATGTCLTPACFVEIERIVKIKKNLSHVIQSVEIVECNYIPDYINADTSLLWGNDRYAFDSYADSGVFNFPTDYQIKDKLNNNTYINMTSDIEYVIYVDYWVTWSYENLATTNNTGDIELDDNFRRKLGKRTKHTIEQTITSSGDTYNMLFDATNSLTYNGTDRIVYY